MAYYTKVLQPDETVKVIGRLHWWIYGRGAVVLGLLARSSARVSRSSISTISIRRSNRS